MSTDAPKGLFESIKALVDRVVTLLHGRAELFTTELQEELGRLIGVLMWAVVAVFTAIIGTTFLAHGAYLNVLINLPGLTDRKAAEGIQKEAKQLMDQVAGATARVTDDVEKAVAAG